MKQIQDEKYFRYYGRIIKKEESVFLGFTNSQVDFYASGNDSEQTTISALIGTKLNGEVNNARLKILIDDNIETASIIELNQEEATYTIASFCDNNLHKISMIKITEAAMSYAKLSNITIQNGDIHPLQTTIDTRKKIEFIGDSITCGYGVYGEPDSEYNIREEDGLVTYAALTAKNLNLNARYFSVSGYGMYMKYDGDLDGVVPKVYPYTNYFVDEEETYDFTEFVPDIIVINLGTNDSGHLDKKEIQAKFIESYVTFLEFLKEKYPTVKILCICGTLCMNAFPFIEEAVNKVNHSVYNDIHSFELPYHNIESDGMASGHPSIITHQKDAERLTQKLKELYPDILN